MKCSKLEIYRTTISSAAIEGIVPEDCLECMEKMTEEEAANGYGVCCKCYWKLHEEAEKNG